MHLCAKSLFNVHLKGKYLFDIYLMHKETVKRFLLRLLATSLFKIEELTMANLAYSPFPFFLATS